jgi:hypothetical protein
MEESQAEVAVAKTPKIRIDYIDVPDVPETFADAVQELVFDGQTFRVVLGVTRMDERKGEGPFTGRRYTACRVVLPPSAAMDLSRKLGRVLAAMLKQGMLEKAAKAG